MLQPPNPFGNPSVDLMLYVNVFLVQKRDKTKYSTPLPFSQAMNRGEWSEPLRVGYTIAKRNQCSVDFLLSKDIFSLLKWNIPIFQHKTIPPSRLYSSTDTET